MIYKRMEKLALVHIARTQCGLDDDCYRAMLQSCAGVDSASKLKTEAQFNAVMAAFKKLGFVSIAKKNARQIEAVKAKAANILGDNYEIRLSGYLRKLGRPNLTACSQQELRRIMGFLSAMERKGGPK